MTEPTTTPAALEHTARQSRRTLEEIAARMGRSATYLAKATNPNQRERLAAVDLVPFMRAAESLLPLRVIATEMNCVVVELPTETQVEDVFAAFTRLVSEVGEDSQAIRDALADRVITSEEGQRIARDLDQTVESALALKATILARVTAKPATLSMSLEPPIGTRRSA